MAKKKQWHEYLWLWPIIYFSLGFFNILFAWLGMIDFIVPLLFALIGGNKFFCNSYCGRGQLFTQLGKGFGLSALRPSPRLMTSKGFRYAFLAFFMLMFCNMLFQTWLVAEGAASLNESVRLFWAFQLPWGRAYTGSSVPAWVAQYSFGFYSMMLTSTLLGLVVMALYKPRTWCSFCPMGTMTQEICRRKAEEHGYAESGPDVQR